MFYEIQSNLFKYIERLFANHKLKWRAEDRRKVMQWVAYSLFPLHYAVIRLSDPLLAQAIVRFAHKHL